MLQPRYRFCRRVDHEPGAVLNTGRTPV